ncbi:hypothetical protein Ahy_B02g059889 [Arachis hypogaea]|uniref:Uncharacterized protein n=1 Tax=Arachis hypogaea TaxID=3818 RepID=A0A445AHE3_ARAHY|nr:hypothetical protein Ahy_B02g059889 [Arachis hypogaea]
MKYREVYDWFVRKCNVYLNSTCITRALKAAKKVVEGDEIKEYRLVQECARSRTRNEFDRNMNKVKLINEKAWEFLDKWPKEA